MASPMGLQLAEGLEDPEEDVGLVEADLAVFQRMKEAGFLERVQGTDCWRLTEDAAEILKEGFSGRKSS